MNNSFTVHQLIQHLEYEIINESHRTESIHIYTSEFNRPGLQLSGFYTSFVPGRIQIIGGAEWQYLYTLEPEVRRSRIEKLFAQRIPLLIVTRGQEIFPETVELAREYHITILRTPKTTTKVVNELITYMETALAPTIRRHGILMDIYGVGVLITGESGIGKSETALDLIVNGHKLISDDSVIIKKIDDRLIGTSPPVTRHFMEIRGIGIIDIQRLFGVGAVMEQKEIEFIIHLTHWVEGQEYDHLGMLDDFEIIMGRQVKKAEIPLRPGRNTAVIMEIATQNFKQKEMGYNPAEVLNQRIMEAIRINREKEFNQKP
ncbi:MAG: HPr(Ser) kinase/phosphatase [Tissierellia bacterium]|nr:HPr(Ser) kinase/phosphatase [Tissierellia bacterium]